jgi:hypothetical protein
VSSNRDANTDEVRLTDGSYFFLAANQDKKLLLPCAQFLGFALLFQWNLTKLFTHWEMPIWILDIRQTNGWCGAQSRTQDTSKIAHLLCARVLSYKGLTFFLHTCIWVIAKGCGDAMRFVTFSQVFWTFAADFDLVDFTRTNVVICTYTTNTLRAWWQHLSCN